MTAQRILFLAPRVPWPLDTGGKIRTYHLLRVLARHHQVQLLALGGAAADADGLSALARLGVPCRLFPPPSPVGMARDLALGLLGPIPYVVRKYGSRALSAAVKAIGRQRQVDLIHCDHLHLALHGLRSGLPFVIDEHNVESVLWERAAREPTTPWAKRLLLRQQAFWMRRHEARLCAAAAMVLCCSPRDQRALAALIPGASPPVRVVPNGVDLETFAAPGVAENPGAVVFTGSMDWAPNESAVLAFLDEIWPAVRRRIPAARFVVVGRNPGARLRARARPEEIAITGTVPDIRPFLREALALVVPLRVGGGTRLKILEAFAARVPVVSTAVGIEGIDAVAGAHYLAAETAADFASALAQLQAPGGGREALVAAAQEFVRRRYTWDALGEELSRVYGARLGTR